MNILLATSIEKSQLYKFCNEMNDIRSNNDNYEILKFLPSVIENAAKRTKTNSSFTIFEYLLKKDIVILNENTLDDRKKFIKFSLENLLWDNSANQIVDFVMNEYARDTTKATFLNYCMALGFEELTNEIYRRAEEEIYSNAEKLNLEGTLAFKNKDYNKSLELFKDSINASSVFALPHVNMAILYREINEVEKSIDSSKKALDIFPRNKYAHFQLAKSLYKKGENEQALDSLRDIFLLDLDFKKAYDLFVEIKSNSTKS